MTPCRCLAVVALILTGTLFAPGQADETDRVLKLFAEEFVELTPGKGKHPATFDMGSADKAAPDAEKPRVTVTFKKPFAIARYEVTQELYQTVMGNNPSTWKGKRNSVEQVTWDDAVTFCRKATGLMRDRKLIGADEEIRLPSEAEWEYACRAGTKTAYSFGDKADALTDYGWFKGNAAGNDPPVGKKKPNDWGLYDMHGYVWEWCQDTWSADHKGVSESGEPRRDKDAKDRVLRGGAWTDDADSARSAFRTHKASNQKSAAIGFRCVKAKAAKD